MLIGHTESMPLCELNRSLAKKFSTCSKDETRANIILPTILLDLTMYVPKVLTGDSFRIYVYCTINWCPVNSGGHWLEKATMACLHGPRLLNLEKTPPHLQFNDLILTGYRPISTFQGCIRSLFYLHNEFGNIYTHGKYTDPTIEISTGIVYW